MHTHAATKPASWSSSGRQAGRLTGRRQHNLPPSLPRLSPDGLLLLLLLLRLPRICGSTDCRDQKGFDEGLLASVVSWVQEAEQWWRRFEASLEKAGQMGGSMVGSVEEDGRVLWESDDDEGE